MPARESFARNVLGSTVWVEQTSASTLLAVACSAAGNLRIERRAALVPPAAAAHASTPEAELARIAVVCPSPGGGAPGGALGRAAGFRAAAVAVLADAIWIELDGERLRAAAKGRLSTAEIDDLARRLLELSGAAHASSSTADPARSARAPGVFSGRLGELCAIGLFRPALDAFCAGARAVPPSPIDRAYLAKVLDEEVTRQFGHPLRPCVEIVLNGADASRGVGAVVDVLTDGARLEVVDAGEGMNLRTILSRLLLPFATDKRPGVDIGRFGVGFFSVLGLGLADPSTFALDIETGDGSSGFRLAVRADAAAAGAAALPVELSPIAPRTGTHVRVRSSLLDAASVRSYLREKLHFFPPERAVVRMDGVPLNDGSMVSGGRLYEYEVAPGVVGRFHLGGRGAFPSITSAVYHAGVKIDSCFGIGGLVLIDFPPVVELTEGRDALKAGPAFTAVVRAFYRCLSRFARESNAGPRARDRIAEVAAQISALMFQSIGWPESADELARALLGKPRFLVSPDRCEAICGFFGPAVEPLLFVPESFWAEREWHSHLPGERELLEAELEIEAPETIMQLAARRPDLHGLRVLAARAPSPDATLVSLVRGRARGAGALPCFGTRRAVLVREDARAVRSPRGWQDLYALRTSFDRACGMRETDVERDLIVLSPVAEPPRSIRGHEPFGGGA
jgi:hypothetical protein